MSRRSPIVSFLYGLAICLSFGLGKAHAQEWVLSFHADLQVHEDASLVVTETIHIRAEGDIFRRGIVRYFPVIRAQPNSTRRIKVGFEVLSVEKDGQIEPYHLESNYETISVYVGDANIFLQPGREYTYKLTYRTTKQIGFFDDFDELYWNVNGNGWGLPFGKVSATLILPQPYATPYSRPRRIPAMKGIQDPTFR